MTIDDAAGMLIFGMGYALGWLTNWLACRGVLGSWRDGRAKRPAREREIEGRPGYVIFFTTGATGIPAKGIRCWRCGLTSYNQNDVEHRFCPRCRVFHER